MDPTSELWGGGGSLRPGTPADSTHKCSFDSVSYTVNKQRTLCPHEAHVERIKVLMCLIEKIKTWGKKINNLLHVQKPHVETWLKSCGAETYKKSLFYQNERTRTSQVSPLWSPWGELCLPICMAGRGKLPPDIVMCPSSISDLTCETPKFLMFVSESI